MFPPESLITPGHVESWKWYNKNGRKKHNITRKPNQIEFKLINNSKLNKCKCFLSCCSIFAQTILRHSLYVWAAIWYGCLLPFSWWFQETKKKKKRLNKQYTNGIYNGIEFLFCCSQRKCVCLSCAFVAREMLKDASVFMRKLFSFYGIYPECTAKLSKAKTLYYIYAHLEAEFK